MKLDGSVMMGIASQPVRMVEQQRTFLTLPNATLKKNM